MVTAQPKLSFYDVKAKKKFMSGNYKIVMKKNPRTKSTMRFAVTTSPGGTEAWRVLCKK